MKEIIKYKIKKAKKKDIDSILYLLEILFTQEIEFEFNLKKHKKALNKIISDKNIGEIFLLKKKDKIIACVNILYTVSTALGTKVAILEDMVVKADYRNQNFGTKLLRYILKYLKNKKIARITLLTDSDNFQAHKFYEKLNFKKSTMIIYKQHLRK